LVRPNPAESKVKESSMPELPEVETIRLSLLPHVVGMRIRDCEILLPKLIKNIAVDKFLELISGRTIQDIERRGKYLIFRLSGGHSMVVHLRMTGQLRFCAEQAPRLRHTHLIVRFALNQELRYTDIRQFGAWYLAPDAEIAHVAGIDRLGIEPLSPDFTEVSLGLLLSTRKRRIKAALLDQHLLAGVGNIYADEALFAASIHPERTTQTLTPGDISRLHHSLQNILAKGILLRGTSVRDYVDGEGASGSFQQELKVYGRTGRMCSTCNNPIKRILVANRSTHLCPHCQT